MDGSPLSPLTAQRLDTLEAQVLGQLRGEDPRLMPVLTALIRHAHAFVRDAQPTPGEWRAGLEFLRRVAQAVRLVAVS